VTSSAGSRGGLWFPECEDPGHGRAPASKASGPARRPRESLDHSRRTAHRPSTSREPPLHVHDVLLSVTDLSERTARMRVTRAIIPRRAIPDHQATSTRGRVHVTVASISPTGWERSAVTATSTPRGQRGSPRPPCVTNTRVHRCPRLLIEPKNPGGGRPAAATSHRARGPPQRCGRSLTAPGSEARRRCLGPADRVSTVRRKSGRSWWVRQRKSSRRASAQEQGTRPWQQRCGSRWTAAPGAARSTLTTATGRATSQTRLGRMSPKRTRTGRRDSEAVAWRAALALALPGRIVTLQPDLQREPAPGRRQASSAGVRGSPLR
jgi:hypothetical protein